MRSREAGVGDWAGWADGSHDTAYEVLGAHPVDEAATNRQTGTWEFRVWAPNASAISIVGDFNGWDDSAATMLPSDTGVWSATATASHGERYKFRITSPAGTTDKADPFAFHGEEPPGTSSVLWAFDERHWTDAALAPRSGHAPGTRPADVDLRGAPRQLGPPRRPGELPDDRLQRWPPNATAHGFTHVEFLPLTEHPFYGSWGYQTTGYFAPTCRYGSPDDLMAMIDHLHGEGIGVFLDWVPSHFPADEFALAQFDGTHLFEHADPRLGFPPRLEQPDLQLRPQRGALVPRQLGQVLDRPLPRRRACGSTPSHRCCTSTTRAPTASGSRTSTAATRTSRRSASCSSSTDRSTTTTPTST